MTQSYVFPNLLHSLKGVTFSLSCTSAHATSFLKIELLKTKFTRILYPLYENPFNETVDSCFFEFSQLDGCFS